MMIDVDVRSVWNQGRAEFAAWFVAASLFGNFWAVRRSMHLSSAKSVAAAIGMTGVGWMIVCLWPIWLVPYVLAQDYFFGGRPDPYSWIIPVLLCGATGAVVGVTVLLALRQRITTATIRSVLAVNFLSVGLAVYRMACYVSAHPPEA